MMLLQWRLSKDIGLAREKPDETVFFNTDLESDVNLQEYGAIAF
jgi:hypothetical protein